VAGQPGDRRRTLGRTMHECSAVNPLVWRGNGGRNGVWAETVGSYTVIGDKVNVGVRLESLGKEYLAEIIISQFARVLFRKSSPEQE